MGNIFTDKESLIAKIKERVFKNDTFSTTSLDIQSNDVDIVESLWDRGCSEKEFTATGTFLNGTVKRTICGPNVTIVAKINFLSNFNGVDFTGESISFNEIIPLNQSGAQWFKLETIGTVINDITTGGGDFGFFKLNDLSTYTGATVNSGDETKLFIPGVSKGTNHSWSSELGDVFAGGYDNDFGTSTNNYEIDSPKDITVSPLNLIVENNTLGTGNSNFSTNQGSVTIYMKGTLL